MPEAETPTVACGSRMTFALATARWGVVNGPPWAREGRGRRRRHRDGVTPVIGANGNWYLGETPTTGKPARGEKRGGAGEPGADGAKATSRPACRVQLRVRRPAGV